MNEDTIILLENNVEKEYCLLLTIDNKYIIYTDIDNNNINKNIYVIKVDSINDNQSILPITDDELNIINQKYLELIK